MSKTLKEYEDMEYKPYMISELIKKLEEVRNKRGECYMEGISDNNLYCTIAVTSNSDKECFIKFR